jgi:hypothetical protein
VVAALAELVAISLVAVVLLRLVALVQATAVLDILGHLQELPTQVVVAAEIIIKCHKQFME